MELKGRRRRKSGWTVEKWAARCGWKQESDSRPTRRPSPTTLSVRCWTVQLVLVIYDRGVKSCSHQHPSSYNFGGPPPPKQVGPARKNQRIYSQKGHWLSLVSFRLVDMVMSSNRPRVAAAAAASLIHGNGRTKSTWTAPFPIVNYSDRDDDDQHFSFFKSKNKMYYYLLFIHQKRSSHDQWFINLCVFRF